MRPDPICLPLAQWPTHDRVLWMERTQAAGLFDASHAGSAWSPQSRRKAVSGYGRWLAWLMTVDALDPAAPPGQRVTPERVKAFLDHLAQTGAPYTRLCRVQELYDALRVLAPAHDWAWLAGLYRTLRAQAKPARDKRQRLQPADRLADLGLRLMRQADGAPRWSPRRRAVLYRDGLMIVLLAYRPVRIKNFAAMRLGRHLVKQRARHWILFGAAETKSHVPYEAVVPEALEAPLARYLTQHRPVLLRGESGDVTASTDAVWVSEVGTQLEAGALASRIQRQTRSAFGESVPPHWFRDAAATTIALDNPAHVRDAHLVLGHAGLSTTEKHYNQARSIQASRRHQAMLATLRAALKA